MFGSSRNVSNMNSPSRTVRYSVGKYFPPSVHFGGNPKDTVKTNGSSTSNSHN